MANLKRHNMKIFTFIIISLIIQVDSIFAQNVIFSQTDTSMSKNIRLEISSDKSNYMTGEDIYINYKFINMSQTDQKIMIKDYWGFPMGMGTTINNSNDSSICKYPSRHILASQIFTENQLKDYYRKFKPGESIKGRVKLQDIPVFQDFIKDKILPVDIYKIKLSYIWLISNTIMIEIEK